MKRIDSIGDLTLLIERYSIKGTITNNYLLLDVYSKSIQYGLLFYIETKSNVCICLAKQDFYQLYFYINDISEQFDFITDKPVTMEILYRGEGQKPINIINYWKCCGFKQHLIRDNMTALLEHLILPDDKSTDIEIKTASSEIEANFTKNLIEGTFDKYTGDILTSEEINTFVKNKNVLCAYWKGNLSGILQFEIRNNVVWIGHIAISSNFRGKGIAKELVKRYIIQNAVNPKTRYQLWVIQDNENAKSLYKKFGFIYGNKSSASMLRN